MRTLMVNIFLASFNYADQFSAEEYYKNDYPDEDDSGMFSMTTLPN